MQNLKYTSQLILAITHGEYVKDTLSNHGLSRKILGSGSITFHPSLCHSCNYFTIGMHPTMGQTTQQQWEDAKNNRLLITTEIVSEIGEYIILEDHSRYMNLTGNLQNDLITYTSRVISVLVCVTGGAQSAGLSVTKYISSHLALSG